MSESDSSNGMSDELTQHQTEIVLQFQDLTGIDEFETCKQTLSTHNWNLESAVRFTLDGRDSQLAGPSLRPSSQAYLRASTSASTSTSNNNLVHNLANAAPVNPDHNHNQQLTIWSFTLRLFAFPFAFVYDTLLSLLRFAWSIVRPDPRRSVLDPLGDVTRFISQFESRYGSRHPVFYAGTYGQALNDAKKELRFLLVYLHSDSHQDTDHFVTSVLNTPAVIDFIDHNRLLFWACSVSYPEGYRVSLALRESTFPFLSLIVLKQNRMVSVGRFEGRTSVEALLTQLRACIEQNEASLVAARVDREERNMTHLLRQEQDEAFAESLRADQEKERKKKEEKSKREAEEKAKAEIEKQEIDKKDRLMKLKLDLVSLIPEEPSVSQDVNEVTKLVIKLPDGTRLERRFLKSQPIKYLYYYVFCHPQSPLQFQIRTNFPRRDLPGRTPELSDFEWDANGSVIEKEPASHSPTFEEANLGKGDMLFVNDLNA